VSRTLVVLGDIKECPPLIDALDSDKVQVRYLCHEALKTATGQDFGYDHLSDNLTQRHKAVLSWRQWWSEMAGDPWFAKTYANKHGLTDEPATVPPEGDAMPPAPAVEPGRTTMPTKGTQGMTPPDMPPGMQQQQQQQPQQQPQPPSSDDGIQWKEVPADPHSSSITGEHPMPPQPMQPMPKNESRGTMPPLPVTPKRN
jgi:hypothetical protein